MHCVELELSTRGALRLESRPAQPRLGVEEPARGEGEGKEDERRRGEDPAHQNVKPTEKCSRSERLSTP